MTDETKALIAETRKLVSNLDDGVGIPPSLLYRFCYALEASEARNEEAANIIRDQGNAIADLRAKNEKLTVKRAEDKQAVVAVFSAHITVYGYDPGTMLDVLNLLAEKIT